MLSTGQLATQTETSTTAAAADMSGTATAPAHAPAARDGVHASPVAAGASPAAPASSPTNKSPAEGGGAEAPPAAVSRRSARPRAGSAAPAAEASALQRERWVRRIQKVTERNALDRERALAEQRERLLRAHEAELRSLRRDHEDDLRRVRQDARSQEVQLRAQLAEARTLTSSRDLSRLTSPGDLPDDVTSHRVGGGRQGWPPHEQPLRTQSAGEDNRTDVDCVQLMEGDYENESQKYEKANKNTTWQPMDSMYEVRMADERIASLTEELETLKSQLESALSTENMERPQQVPYSGKERPRELQLQLETCQLRNTLQQLRRAHFRERRQLEKKIKKMEGDVKSSRLRAKRAVARLKPATGRERGAKTEEKPAALGEPVRMQKSPTTRQAPSPKRRKATSPPAENDEVVHLKTQVEELQRCIAQLRQAAQVRRSVQLYSSRPHRLLRGKMNGLPTLKENEQYDSMEETSSASADAEEPTSDISDIHLSDLAELSREELQQLCWQLQRAHQQLRQAHDLLALRVRDPTRPGSSRGRARVENELLAAQSLVRDLEAALASKGVDPSALREKSVLTAQNLRLTQKLRELRSREVKVKHELQELRDMNELLEFRILELEGFQEKSGDPSPSEPAPPQSLTLDTSCPPGGEEVNHATAEQTLEAAGEDRRVQPTPPSSAATAAVEPASIPTLPALQQQDSIGEERHHWQQKIAALQSTILQLEAALEENQQQLRLQQECALLTPPERQQPKQTQTEDLLLQPEEALPTASPPPPPAVSEKPVSGHQRQPSGNSESELSDYHSDSNSDGRPPASTLCTCGRGGRPFSSPDSAAPLQESGIFDVDSDEKSCQTDVQQSDVSMRELIELSSEIARLTSVQEQLETSPLQQLPPQTLSYHQTESADDLTESVAEADSCLSAVRPRTALICAEVQTEYLHDQLLCDYRDMCERYQKLKKCKDEVEEEKNELEEAENDARLMVQRLEMKIFASTEVEKMLSSDLAEEQDRCRQLQRQLNSVKLKHQSDLKARQASESTATAEKIQILERTIEELTGQLKTAQELSDKLKESEDKSTATTPVPAVSTGAWELWRSTESSTSDTMSSREPCLSESSTSLTANIPTSTPITSRTESLVNQMHKAWSFNDSGVGEDLSHVAGSIEADVSSLSAPTSSRPAKRPRTEGGEDVDEPVSMVTDASSVCSECTKRLTEKPQEPAAPAVDVDTTPKNSMDSNLSERESYYSECIQELETEKADIRRRWEEEKSDLLRQIDESCQESCQLKQRMDDILQEGEKTKQLLTQKVADLRSELRQQASNSERDRDELVASHELKAQTLQEQQVLLRRRLRAADDVLGALKVELELCQAAEAGRDSPDGVCHAPVLERVRVLQQSQRELTAQVAELEKKEGAYRETLTEADRIMQNVEMRYQKKIEELEDQLREGKSKLALMEETEQRLKQALKTSGGGKHDKERITELLDKLIEIEQEDLQLKEKVYRLERRERELSIKLREEERTSEGLRHELRDQEELLRELDTARRDLGAAQEQLPALTALRQRAAELQQNEEFLRGRIEELEQAELALQDTLRGVKTAQAHKERRSAEQVSSLQQELDQLQQSLQEVQLQASEGQQERSRLRRQLQEAHRQLEDAHRDLENTSGSASQAETQFRNEVSKLRNQLSLVNSQLTDNDSYSCQLRDQLEKVQCENCELRTALDGQKSRAEQDIIQLNLEISRREEEISALSDQLAELDKSQLAGELDVLADQESTLVRLLALARQSDEQVRSCQTCAGRVDDALRTVVQQLEQLTQLLGGADMQQSLHSQLRDAEQLQLASVGTQAELPAAPTVAAQVQTETIDEEEAAALTQLRAELLSKEHELSLMDGQGSYLQDQLERRDDEMQQLRSRLVESDTLLDHQRSQHGRLTELLTQAHVERDEAAARADTKDRLIGAVLRHLQAVLEASQAAAIARGLRENADAETDRQDFDREVICQILQQIVATMRDRVLRSRSSQNGTPDQHSTGATSRIPRPVPRSRESTPPCTPNKDQHPRMKAPKPRCLQPKRAARPAPPVGVARPYRTLAAADSARERVSPRLAKSPAPALATPENFQIIRAVGGDSLLLYWSPPDDTRCNGYEIFVNNRLQQVIRNPQRTKALLPSLRLSAQMQLAIRAVGPHEAASALVWAEFRPGQTPTHKSSSHKTPHASAAPAAPAATTSNSAPVSHCQ